MSDPRRRIPGVDRLLESDAVAWLLEAWPRERVVEALRSAIEAARRDAAGAPDETLDDPERYASQARARLLAADRPSLRAVVNATGVVLHTNLGRAPLARAAREAMERVARGYSNLEYDLDEGRRGSRYGHCVGLLRESTGAEDALVVNNNAAALVLALNTMALGRPVLVSRGELVEIGGGFRIPEMLERAGARLVEVGSTNRTRVEDYRRAASESDPGALLKVHRSNFSMTGFTEEASLEALADLARELDVPLLHDLGSGLLLDPRTLGLPAEPRPAASVAAGADVVCFSGDKLLGGPQAGILAGSTRWIAEARENPLCRALRVDKVTLSALEATLALHRDPAAALRELPALAALAAEPDALRGRAEGLASALAALGVEAGAEESTARVGGGTYPGVELASWAVRVTPGGALPSSAGALARGLRDAQPPVVARVESGAVVLDVRTLLPDEEEWVLEAFREIASTARGGGAAGDA